MPRIKLIEYLGGYIHEYLKSNAAIWLPLLVATLICGACADKRPDRDKELESLLEQVDREFDNVGKYQQEKENKINLLKAKIASEKSEKHRYALTGQLVEEYEAFISDSALVYINRNLHSKTAAENPQLLTEALIKKADICAHAGLFTEARRILNSIKSSEHPLEIREYLFSVYSGLYQYESEYSSETDESHELEKLRALYSDSLKSIAPEESFARMVCEAPQLIENGKNLDVINHLSNEAGVHPPGTRKYSILHSIIAYAYKRNGDRDNYRKHLALTVISDLKGSVKENMAIRELATAMYEDGDISRAQRYLKQSFEDANFYAARMRNAQSARMLPVIDRAFNERQQQMLKTRKGLLIAISTLAIILILAALMMFRQYLREKKTNLQIQSKNRELTELSARLKDAVEELAATNQKLKESDNTKGIYAALFMEYCSSILSTLQSYHKSLHILSVQSSKAALMKKLESSEIIDKAINDFYYKFDEAILHILPNFVEKVNTLLKPGEQSVIKNNELLNTELRVFALIRIGINDSAKIAEFLRCSITTVYTYRSKIKKRALSPNTFEEDLMKIG